MANDVEQQKVKITALLQSLDGGRKVTLRDMRAVLAADEIEGYENDWQSVQALKQDQKELVEQLRDYEDLLRVADGVFTRTKSETQARSAYEKAFERLEELLAGNKRLSEVLDRGLGQEAQDATQPCATDAPRSIFSRSKYRRDIGAHYGSKGDAKRRALESKLRALEAMSKTAKKNAETPKERLARLAGN